METSQRAAVSFSDVAASFSSEQWDVLEEWQRTLYGNVMRDIHNVLHHLGYHIENSEVLIRIISQEESGKRGRCQEGPGPDIILQINYQGPEDVCGEGKLRATKTEADFVPWIKQEEHVDDSRVSNTSLNRRPHCPPGLVLDPIYPLTGKKEAEDGGVFNLTENSSEWTMSRPRPLCNSWSPGHRNPEQPGRDRTCRRKGVARQVKSVSALHDSDQNKQTEPKENEAPRQARLLRECEASFPGIKPPHVVVEEEEIRPISIRQQGQTFLICSECGKTFCNNSSFQAHMRTHTGERPYKCTHCDKTFIRGSHLKIHLRTHTGERPYKCSQCDKSFRDNSCFARHQRIHTGEKPYQCTTCGKYFRKKSNLKDHQRTHTGERPYKCKHCDKTFHQRSNHRVHEKNHHRD